jgi:DNA-binding NtrC family response regulator
VKARIAVLDNEPRMVEVLAMLLARDGHEPVRFGDPGEALAALEKDRFDLLISDLRMPGIDGLEVVRRARAADPDLPVLVLTAHGSIESAVEAMRRGAYDYIEKPFDNEALKALVARALERRRLSRENRYLRAEVRGRYASPQIVAESDAMRAVLELVRRAARSPSTVLITGESGTGKELVARALHVHSDRVGEPFVAVNCQAFAEGVLASELFGHERGSFTGAERSRAGLFEQADGGTLFLDEIGEVSADFQGKLLRVVQERVVRRVGAERGREVDVRVVAATNRDLRREVKEGRFREDLYFRLAVIPIHLPPLRERREEVLPLARHFVRKWSTELAREVRGWTDEVERYLLAYDWPGNVRELENAIERGVVLARSERIELDDLRMDAPATGSGRPEGAASFDAARDLREFLDAAAAERIRSVLRECGGVRVDAAQRLGVDRTTLYRLMRKYSIEE